MKVRGEWGFSTAGRTLLCLTLTGVSAKSWLSCKHIRDVDTHNALGPWEALVLIQFAQQEQARHANLELGLFKQEMCVFTLSSVPVRRIPTCCILLEVVRVLLQDHRFQTQVSNQFKGTLHSRTQKHIFLLYRALGERGASSLSKWKLLSFGYIKKVQRWLPSQTCWYWMVLWCSKHERLFPNIMTYLHKIIQNKLAERETAFFNSRVKSL